ncbi:MAG: HAMP domain-containing protein [Deltaproteobacteria bacterium]|nr:HAMP domain-containing protein [Deltaproteobacteria bacterium]
MLKTISISTRLFIFTGLLLLFAAGIGFFALRNIETGNIAMSSVYNRHVIPMNELHSLNHLLRTGIIRPVDQLLLAQITLSQCQARVSQAIGQINSHWQKLHDLHVAGSHASESDWLNSTKSLAIMSQHTLERLVVILRTQKTIHLSSFKAKFLDPLASQYSEITALLIKQHLSGIAKAYNTSQNRYKQDRSYFIWSLLLGLLLTGIISVLLVRSINKPLGQISRAMDSLMIGDLSGTLIYDHDDEFGTIIKSFNKMVTNLNELISTVESSGIQVTSSITEIAASTRQQEATVNEHAAASNEIAASTTEIAATAENLMDTMSKVTDMVHNTTMATSLSHNRLNNINKIMRKMEDSTVSIVNRLSVLNEKADNIVVVTKTINKIADQTNLLSLNAAIEAEKAGEYGAGFSVVSSEIRRLADQTAVATFDIEQMVNDVRSAIAGGVASIEKFADNVRRSFSDVQISSNQISEVINQVEALSPPIETVNNGIEAQSMGARQINEAVGQLNEAAQQIAGAVGQSSSIITRLSSATQALRESVSQFKLHKNKT